MASDGTVFVGELKGFPFRPGSSNVWRIDPGAQDALCSTSVADPSCSKVPGRFTAIQDIAVDLSERALYLYELAAGGVLAFEAGFESGDFPPAVLLKVTGADRAPSSSPASSASRVA